MMFQTVLEPVVVGPEPDQDPGWATVPSDDNFFGDREPKVFGKVSHFWASAFVMIARISTASRVTS